MVPMWRRGHLYGASTLLPPSLGPGDHFQVTPMAALLPAIFTEGLCVKSLGLVRRSGKVCVECLPHC